MSQSSEISENDINILLLGETGAGKSTTLNALVNYIKFSGDFKEALTSLNDLEEVIPTHFTLPHPTTGEPITIESGDDANERQRAGLSATIAPIAYTFNYGEKLIRVIDTPGIGDTAGSKEDKENFEQILLFLHHHKKLNAILFIVNGINARKTLFFRYCITQLLLHLHKSISENIVFCFTHSRHSMFGPGEGFTTLKSFLEDEIKEVKLELIPGKNCFFIDNDSYRFLVAKRQNYLFDEGMEAGFCYSWERSVKQIEQMLPTIIALPPHNLAKTVSLNEARIIILELAQPLIQVQATIKSNIDLVKQRARFINSPGNELKELDSLLKMEIWEVRSVKLDYPSTVCANRRCIELDNSNGIEKVMYKTRCHEKCGCMFVTPHMTNQAMLLICKAMKRNLLGLVTMSTVCKYCGCSWSDHMHISWEYIKEKKRLIDDNATIDCTKNKIEQLKQARKAMENFASEYENEFKIIQEISIRFDCLLKSNSYFTYHNIFGEYLNNLIDEESKKEHPKIEPLIQIKEDHENGVRILTEEFKQKSESFSSLEIIPVLKSQLLNLKHNGETFRQILETNQLAKEQQFNYQEKSVPLDRPKEAKANLDANCCNDEQD